MPDQNLTINITTDSRQATANLDQVAAKVKNIGHTAAAAGGGMGSLTASIRGAAAAMRGLTTLFGLTGAIGGVFMLISTVQRLYDLWKKLTEPASDPSLAIARSTDAAARGVKKLAQEYDSLAAARDRAAKAGADLDQAILAKAAAQKETEHLSDTSPEPERTQRKERAHLLHAYDTASYQEKHAETTHADAQQLRNEIRQHLTTLHTRRQKMEELSIRGESEPARARARAALPVIDEEITKQETALNTATSSLDTATVKLAAAVQATANAAIRIQNHDRDAAKKAHDEQYEADLAEAEQAHDHRQRLARKQAAAAAVSTARAALETAAPAAPGAPRPGEGPAAPTAPVAPSAPGVPRLGEGSPAPTPESLRAAAAQAGLPAIRTALETAAERIASITVEAPRAASTAAQTGGITGGMLNNTQRLADQRAAQTQTIIREALTTLTRIEQNLKD